MDIFSFDRWFSVFAIRLLSHKFHQSRANAIVTVVRIVVIQSTVSIDIASIVGVRVVRSAKTYRIYPMIRALSTQIFPMPSRSHISYINYHFRPINAGITAYVFVIKGNLYKE